MQNDDIGIEDEIAALAVSTGDRVPCQCECGAQFHSKKARKRHVAECRLHQHKLICPVCRGDRRFNRPLDLQQHMRTVHNAFITEWSEDLLDKG